MKNPSYINCHLCAHIHQHHCHDRTIGFYVARLRIRSGIGNLIPIVMPEHEQHKIHTIAFTYYYYVLNGHIDENRYIYVFGEQRPQHRTYNII